MALRKGASTRGDTKANKKRAKGSFIKGVERRQEAAAPKDDKPTGMAEETGEQEPVKPDDGDAQQVGEKPMEGGGKLTGTTGASTYARPEERQEEQDFISNANQINADVDAENMTTAGAMPDYTQDRGGAIDRAADVAMARQGAGPDGTWAGAGGYQYTLAGNTITGVHPPGAEHKDGRDLSGQRFVVRPGSKAWEAIAAERQTLGMPAGPARPPVSLAPPQTAQAPAQPGESPVTPTGEPEQYGESDPGAPAPAPAEQYGESDPGAPTTPMAQGPGESVGPSWPGEQLNFAEQQAANYEANLPESGRRGSVALKGTPETVPVEPGGAPAMQFQAQQQEQQAARNAEWRGVAEVAVESVLRRLGIGGAPAQAAPPTSPGTSDAGAPPPPPGESEQAPQYQTSDAGAPPPAGPAVSEVGTPAPTGTPGFAPQPQGPPDVRTSEQAPQYPESQGMQPTAHPEGTIVGGPAEIEGTIVGGPAEVDAWASTFAGLQGTVDDAAAGTASASGGPKGWTGPVGFGGAMARAQ